MRVRWAPAAIDDRDRLIHYIAEFSVAGAVRTDRHLDAASDLLMRFPLSGRSGRVPGTRELVIQDTPYLAIYEVRSELVVILRVIHGAQMWPPA